MTASTPMLHGPDLDECCSNVFALTDLCGLKWRKYVFNLACGANPVDDPVLKSFSSALSHDILCAWRRSPSTGCQSNSDPDSINSAKELWVFWFGDDPNLQGIVSAELKESCHGCWEDGLPHEPRSLLFKALHNLLERCLLSRKFVRLGKWFTKPCEDGGTVNSRNHLSFSFSFFIHGESSVCTAVEIQRQQRIRHLTLEDVAVAATRQEGLPVLLGPYGLSGFLTGQTSHLDELVSSKLVEEWKKFYPLDFSSDWSESASQFHDKGVPAAVLVVVEETQMWYPSLYVVVPHEERADGSVLTRTDTATSAGPTSLTPPASPLDPNTADVVTGPANRPPAPKTTSPGVVDKKKLTHSLVQEVWQEITVTKPAVNKSSSLNSISKATPSPLKMDSSGDVTPVGQWDFEEPFKRTSCSCTSSSNISRPKAPTQVRSFGITRPIPSPSNPLPSPQQQQQQTLQQQSQNSAKLKKEKKKPLVPFHHRLSLDKDRPEAVKSHVGAMTKGLPTANILTSVTQKRHPEVAFPHNAKKYSLQGQTTALQNTTGMHGQNSHAISVKSESKVSQPSASLLRVNSLIMSSQTLVNGHPELLVKREQEVSGDDFVSKEYIEDTEQNCYLLPGEDDFSVPPLPGDPLDCRPVGDLAIPKDVLTPQTPLEPTLWESGKRPSTDGGFECVPSPAKRRRESSTGRSRSDSTGGGRPKGRRNSSQPSPVTTPLSDPFTPQPEDQEMEMIQPLIKSPTQVKVPSNKPPRRRSSSTTTDSPSVPVPADLGKPPSRVKNRRASSRKKQQDEKERLSKGVEEIKPSPQKSEKGTFPSFSSSDDEHDLIPRSSNLMTEQDLAVTLNDLDQLFDTDEEDDELGQSKSLKMDFVSHQAPPFDPITNINPHHSMINTGVVAQHDLQRMFPTPPSLETVTHSPPCSVGNDYISPGSVKTIVQSAMLSPESHHLMPFAGVDMEQDKQHSPTEVGPVFEIPKFQEFPVSYSFEAVQGFPSYKVLPSEMQYLPSWQVSSKTWTLSSVTKVESAPDILNCDVAMGTPSPAVGYTYTHPASVNSDVKHLTSAAMSPASPASSVSSFSLPMQFPKAFHGGSLVMKPVSQTTLPEVNSLSKVLTLSDSSANYFSDKSYDNVSLCSCSASSEGVPLKGTLSKGKNSDWCVCGFGALEGNKFTAGTGLFPDDVYATSSEIVKPLRKEGVTQPVLEVKKEGSTLLCAKRRGSTAIVPSQVPFSLLEEIVSQCSSPLACANLKYQLMLKAHHGIVKQVSGAWSQNKGQESGILQSIPHPNAVDALNYLRQLMQDALQKSTSRKTWEQPNGTVVQGPLSWKQLHHLATKGNEDTPRAQPIPSVTVGYGGDWMSLSPIALQFWEKLLLEPYSCQRDVAYIVVAPENDLVLNSVKLFFKEFSAVYETCRLGQHVAITKLLRDGILRIGQRSLKLAKEPVDDWFTQQGCSSDGAKLKLYAQVFKHHLGPYLASLSLDRHLLDCEKGDKSDEKLPSKFGIDSERSGMDTGNKPVGNSAGTPNSEQAPSAFGEDESEQNSEDPPTVVVYVVNPFSSNSREESFPSYLGLLRCIAEIVPDISENGKKNIIFQVVPIQQILQVDLLTGSRDAAFSVVKQLKCLAFSVFSRCRKSLQLNINAKSLTGFGPAARHEALLRQREVENAKVYSAPYVLCHPIPLPPPDSADETASNLLGLTQNASVLYCGYCLSHDDSYLLAVCTDSVGELIESSVISIEPRLRPDGRPRKTAARTKALIKLWEFCQGVIATSLVPWRLVISKLGRIGPEELKDWKEILSKTSVMAGDQMFKDNCKACFSMKQKNRPAILGTSLMSLEPEPSIKLYMARALPKVNSLFEGNNNSRTSVGSVPKPDVSRTYIAVMPVASLKCSIGKNSNMKAHAPPDTTTETVVTDTDILLAGVDDDENDQDPLRHLFPLLNTSPPTLSPTGMLPLDSSPMQGASPLSHPTKLSASPGVSVPSPFQPISRLSPFQPLHSTPSPSLANVTTMELQEEDGEDSLCVPQAQGYIISTVQTGKMPGTFWASSSHSETSDPVILKAALHIHNPDLMEGINGFVTAWHALATKSHCHVLRSILQTYDALSWLTVDAVNRDRRSCLPVHLYMLCQLHDTLSVLLENQSSQ